MNFLYNIYAKNRLPLLVFTLLIFVIGICFGSIAVKTVDFNVQQDLFSYFNNFMKGFNNLDYQKSTLISDSIKFNLLNMAIIWIFGFSVVIMPLIPVLVFFKGFVLGFTIGFLASEFNIQGIIIAMVTIFPQNILIVPVYILAGLTGIAFSIQIIRYYRGRARLTFQDFLDYSLRMVLLTVLLIGGSLVETYISPILFELLTRYLT